MEKVQIHISDISHVTALSKNYDDGKRPLGRCRCKWTDNNQMDPTEIRWTGVT
jgi:hypothetical protein